MNDVKGRCSEDSSDNPAETRERVGIVTVLFNSSEVLPDFFQSIRLQTHRNFTVYAIDNASTDGSAELCREQGSDYVVLCNATNTGFAHATNQGIRLALHEGCSAVLLLNNDVSFQADFLDHLMKGMRRNHADIAAPITFYHDSPQIIWAAGGRLQRWAGYRPVHLGMGQIDAGQFSSDLRIQFAPGSGILASRAVFESIGFLDETFFTYWEDTDFAVRALKKGLRVFLIPNARLWHKVSSLAGKDSPFQRYYAVRNHALYIRKHCGFFEARLLSALYQAAYAVAGLLKPKDKSRIRAWKDGIQLAKHTGH